MYSNGTAVALEVVLTIIPRKINFNDLAKTSLNNFSLENPVPEPNFACILKGMLTPHIHKNLYRYNILFEINEQ